MENVFSGSGSFFPRRGGYFRFFPGGGPTGLVWVSMVGVLRFVRVRGVVDRFTVRTCALICGGAWLRFSTCTYMSAWGLRTSLPSGFAAAYVRAVCAYIRTVLYGCVCVGVTIAGWSVTYEYRWGLVACGGVGREGVVVVVV